MKNNFNAVIAIVFLVIVAAACNGSFTTANISSFTFSKSDSGEPAITSAEAGEKIFAVAIVSNTSQKLKMNFKVIYENVPGMEKGEEGLSKDLEFEGARPVFLTFTPPIGGDYKVEATLIGEDGKEIDKKSGTITVKGDSSPSKTNSSEDDDK